MKVQRYFEAIREQLGQEDTSSSQPVRVGVISCVCNYCTAREIRGKLPYLAAVVAGREAYYPLHAPFRKTFPWWQLRFADKGDAFHTARIINELIKSDCNTEIAQGYFDSHPWLLPVSEHAERLLNSVWEG